MSFSLPKFLKTLMITLFIGFVIVAGLRAVGIMGRSTPSASDDPSQLVQKALDGLEALRQRKPGERRPASFDAVLAPLDALLKKCRTLMESETFDPIRDYQKIRSLALPVIDIATKADNHAKTEIGFMTKEYRFNAQRAEACQYLASTLWERISLQAPEQSGYFSESSPPSVSDMAELKRLLDLGTQSDPENADLFYLRGIVHRADGLFAAAERDLQKTVTINPDMAGAWNTLGLVRINLKNFDAAEQALERARAVSLRLAEDLNLDDPGPEYTAILYNLATFHEGLAVHYTRDNRITPTIENQHLAQRHTTEARRYFQEFLTREHPNSPDAISARVKLQNL